jgi:hypothetical protein
MTVEYAPVAQVSNALPRTTNPVVPVSEALETLTPPEPEVEEE